MKTRKKEVYELKNHLYSREMITGRGCFLKKLKKQVISTLHSHSSKFGSSRFSLCQNLFQLSWLYIAEKLISAIVKSTIGYCSDCSTQNFYFKTICLSKKGMMKAEIEPLSTGTIVHRAFGLLNNKYLKNIRCASTSSTFLITLMTIRPSLKG